MQLQLGQESNGNGTPELYETGTGLELNFGVMLVFWALLSALGDGEFGEKKNDLSGLPKRRRSNRLFYMLNTDKGLKTVPSDQLDYMKLEFPHKLWAVWAMSADQARQKIEEGRAEHYLTQKMQEKKNFAGDLLNCIAWQKVENKQGKEVTRCFIYAPNCKKQSCTQDTTEKRAEGKKPKASKNVSGIYTSCKSYFRSAAGKLKCAKYGLTCSHPDVQCASAKAPIPWSPIPQKETEYSEQAIKSVAKMLSDEMNETLDDTKRVMRLVQEYGGIAPYKSGYLSEEYKDIPSKYKSHEGIKIDELSQEIGMTQAELVEAINKAEDARLRLPKGKRRFSIKEMMFDAEQFLAKSEAEGFAGLADLETYYWKQTGEKVLVSDFPTYARGPAFSRADRYRYGLYDEKKEKYGSLSYREIEKLLSTTKPGIQLRLFGIKYNQSGFAGLGKFKKLTSKERIEPGEKPKREPEQQERQIIQAKLDWQKKIKLQIDRFDQLKPGDRIWNTFVKGYYKVVKVNQKSVILDSEQLYKKFGKGEPMPDRMKFNYTEPLRRLSPKDEKVEFEKFYKSSDKPTPQTKTVTSRTKPEQLRLFGRLLALRIAGKERRLQ